MKKLSHVVAIATDIYIINTATTSTGVLRVQARNNIQLPKGGEGLTMPQAAVLTRDALVKKLICSLTTAAAHHLLVVKKRFAKDKMYRLDVADLFAEYIETPYPAMVKLLNMDEGDDFSEYFDEFEKYSSDVLLDICRATGGDPYVLEEKMSLLKRNTLSNEGLNKTEIGNKMQRFHDTLII